MAAAVLTADARGAVPADAVPDAPADVRVAFQTQAGPVVQAVTIDGLRAGERVALSCRNCLGQTAVEAEAVGARHVFRPKLRLNGTSRLEVLVVGRNFSRTRAYRVTGGRLELDARTCASVAENRRVRCASLNARAAVGDDERLLAVAGRDACRQPERRPRARHRRGPLPAPVRRRRALGRRPERHVTVDDARAREPVLAGRLHVPLQRRQGPHVPRRRRVRMAARQAGRQDGRALHLTPSHRRLLVVGLRGRTEAAATGS